MEVRNMQEHSSLRILASIATGSDQEEDASGTEQQRHVEVKVASCVAVIARAHVVCWRRNTVHRSDPAGTATWCVAVFHRFLHMQSNVSFVVK